MRESDFAACAFCPACGLGARYDEDGLCTGCGATVCVGSDLRKLLREAGYEVFRRCPAHDFACMEAETVWTEGVDERGNVYFQSNLPLWFPVRVNLGGDVLSVDATGDVWQSAEPGDAVTVWEWRGRWTGWRYGRRVVGVADPETQQ